MNITQRDINLFLILAGSLLNVEAFSQTEQELIRHARKLHVVPNRAYINCYSELNLQNVHKDSLRNGFRILLKDTSYKIAYFLLSYDTEDGDIWEKLIYGDSVIPSEVRILRRLKQGEAFYFTHFKLLKDGRSFTMLDFYILIDENMGCG